MVLFKTFVLLVVPLCLDRCFTRATIISSISQLEMLAQSEKEMYAAFQSFIRGTSKHDGVDDIRRFNDEISTRDVYAAIGDYMKNPLNAFHFIKRMHDVWGNILTKLECQDCLLDATAPLLDLRRRFQEINQRYGGKIHVTSDDVHYAAMAVVRLWQTYQLNISSLFSGEILDEITSPLTTDEVLYIINQLVDDKFYYKAEVWLLELQKHMQQFPEVYTDAECVKVARILASVYAKAGMLWKSVDILETEKVGKEDVILKKIERDLTYYRQKANDIPFVEQNQTLFQDERDVNKAHYEALCRGDIPRTTKVASQLRCIYRPTKIAYYRVKEEIMNFKPRVSIFYDVITSKEIDYIIEPAKARLEVSLVVIPGSKGDPQLGYRVSQTTWFRDYDDPVLNTITKRIELVTGLSAQQTEARFDGEDLQMQNYGVGGMYEVHTDFLDCLLDVTEVCPRDSFPEIQGSGDREATWMFYLTDVNAGGATVFTDLNVTVAPVKGAAVFWYDIDRSGRLDYDTSHAGCPVLLGSKWVANKWIRQRGQIFKRPCGLHPSSIDLPVPS